MNKRPKSREETPKEGGGNAKGSRPALQQYVIAPHKTQGVLTYFFGPCAHAENPALWAPPAGMP